jgi:hypothetical protein
MLTTITRRSKCRGISTAEVLAGSMVSLIILGVVAGFFKTQETALATASTYDQSQVVTRTVMDLFSRELRMASYDPTGLALVTSPGPNCPGVKQGIVEATPSRVHFRQDLNGDGVILGPGEDVAYDVAGTQLTRTDGANLPVPIVDGVPSGGLTFLYFDANNPPNQLVPAGAPAALTPGQRDCVAKIRVTVQASLANPDPRNPTPRTSTVESEIAIRNRSLVNF